MRIHPNKLISTSHIRVDSFQWRMSHKSSDGRFWAFWSSADARVSTSRSVRSQCQLLQCQFYVFQSSWAWPWYVQLNESVCWVGYSFKKIYITRAGVALCLARLCWTTILFLVGFWIITPAFNRSGPGCSLGELWPVSDILACPDDRFSSEELLLWHCCCWNLLLSL